LGDTYNRGEEDITEEMDIKQRRESYLKGERDITKPREIYVIEERQKLEEEWKKKEYKRKMVPARPSGFSKEYCKVRPLIPPAISLINPEDGLS